jgi:hypothetical protein
MRDALTDSLNAPAGRLVEVLLKKFTKGDGDSELSAEMRRRLDKLVDAQGRPGFLARIRLAAEVATLFERAPVWTRTKIVPLFDWTCPDAGHAWAARKYAKYIGPPELFRLTKQPFLEMFGRNDAAAEDLHIFAEWLTAIIIANQQCSKNHYPLTVGEARSALRRAGDKALPTVGHRLALEMERAKPEDKATRWRTIVGPVFQAIWPLDVELQTSASTFQLTQILRAAGDAFSEAADVIIPFIRPDDPDKHSTVFSIAEAPEILYASAPGKMLDLLAAIVGEAAPHRVYSLNKALNRISAIDPSLANSRKFHKLLSYAAS